MLLFSLPGHLWDPAALLGGTLPTPYLIFRNPTQRADGAPGCCGSVGTGERNHPGGLQTCHLHLLTCVLHCFCLSAGLCLSQKLQPKVMQRDVQMVWASPTRFLKLSQDRRDFKCPGAWYWVVNSFPNPLHNTSSSLPWPRTGTKSGFSPLFLELLFNQAFAISTAVICKALQCILFQMVHRKPILAVTKCSELTTTFLLLFGSGLIFSYELELTVAFFIRQSWKAANQSGAQLHKANLLCLLMHALRSLKV